MKTKDEKMKILERLVREGHITLCEAVDLSETEKEYVSIPNPITYTTYPTPPHLPPYTITCTDNNTRTTTTKTI